MMNVKTWGLVIVAIMVLTGCGAKQNPAPGVPQAPPVAQISQDWKSDGIIADGEYATRKMIGEIEVFTRVEGNSAMFAMRARTTGWLALGIEPEDKMKGADIWMCYVKDGKAVVVDMLSTGVYGPHPADEQQGGKSDVAMVSGTQQDGVTTIEFKRMLNTGDSKDKSLKLGENKVIWAIGDSSEISAKHSRRGYGALELR